MADDRNLRIARSVLLVLLTGTFLWFLFAALIRDEPERGFGRLAPGGGKDPGIRVLITNRIEVMGEGRAPPVPSRTWNRLVIQTLAPCDVWTPDDAANPDRRSSLPAGATLTFTPDLNGITLSSQQWGTGGKDLQWPVTRVIVQPRQTEPPPLDGGSQRDPGSFEGEDGRPTFLVGRNRYRGSIEVVASGFREVQAINHLPIEAYLSGVLGIEMSPGYPLEALKAQAIASRGFALVRRQMARRAKAPYDLTDGEDDQEYRGAGNSAGAVVRAAFETRGIAMVVNGAPFLPLFSACSGGSTASADWVVPGGTDLTGRVPLANVMVPGIDPFAEPGCRALGYLDSHWRTSAVITGREIQNRVGAWLQPQGRTIGYIKDLKVGKRDPITRRVVTVAVHHTQGDPIEVPANLFRMLVSPSRIRSTVWSDGSPRKIDSADRKSKNYQITCQGWGHGAGMSQVSAWEMARLGWPSERILRRFYAAIDLVRLW